MPFRLGLSEIIVVLVIILIIFGVGKLSQIGGAIGKSIKEFQKARKDDDEKGSTAARSAESEENNKS